MKFSSNIIYLILLILFILSLFYFKLTNRNDYINMEYFNKNKESSIEGFQNNLIGIWKDPKNSFYSGMDIKVKCNSWEPVNYKNSPWRSSSFKLENVTSSGFYLVEIKPNNRSYVHYAKYISQNKLSVRRGNHLWKLNLIQSGDKLKTDCKENKCNNFLIGTWYCYKNPSGKSCSPTTTQNAGAYFMIRNDRNQILADDLRPSYSSEYKNLKITNINGKNFKISKEYGGGSFKYQNDLIIWKNGYIYKRSICRPKLLKSGEKLKPGNNGTVNGNTFCRGSWQGWSAANCVRMLNNKNCKYMDCNTVPFSKSKKLGNYTATCSNIYPKQKLKRGNNGTVSGRMFCNGTWGGWSGQYCKNMTSVDKGRVIDCNTVPGLNSGGRNAWTATCTNVFGQKLKGGNNGTVNGNTFCRGKQWGGWSLPSCINMTAMGRGRIVDCNTVPGLNSGGPTGWTAVCTSSKLYKDGEEVYKNFDSQDSEDSQDSGTGCSDKNDYLNRQSSNCKKLITLPLKLTDISVSNGLVYAISNNSNSIMKTDKYGNMDWQEVSSPWVSKIHVVNNQMYGIGKNNSVYNQKVGIEGWNRITSPWVKEICVHNNVIYGLGSNGKIYGHHINGGGWRKITRQGWVSQFDVYNGYIYGIGSDYSVFRHSIKGDKWKKITTPWVSYISVNNNYIYGVGNDHKVYKHYIDGGSWDLAASCFFKKIKVENNIVYGIGLDGYVWNTPIITKKFKYSGINKYEMVLQDLFKYQQKKYYKQRRDPFKEETDLDNFGKWKQYSNSDVYPKRAKYTVIIPLLPGDIVALWNPCHKRFMRMNGSTGNVDSCCTHSKRLPANWSWERWVVVDAGGSNMIALWNPQNKRFARMNANGNVDSCCQHEMNLPTGWTWERWQVKNLGNNQIALWNPQNKRFARMNENGNVDSGQSINFDKLDKNKWNSGAPICGEKWLIIQLSKSLGCWKDRGNRAIPNANRYGYYINNNSYMYKNTSNPINKCQQLAAYKGHRYFAVQDGGWCATGPYASSTYKKYGKSDKCYDGKGGAWTNNVYRSETLNIPLDCMLSQWSNWSKCAGNCLGGTQYRTKGIVIPQKNGGRGCPPVPRRQNRKCTPYPCGRVYVLGNYGMGPWGGASYRFFRGGGGVSQWIWNIPGAERNAPVGITIPLIKIHYSRGRMRLVLRIASDDQSWVYLNGRFIGHTVAGWQGTANTIYCTVNNGRNVFQFNCRNSMGPAGLAVYAYNRDNGAYQFKTDGSWKILK